jgi:hypothetical protein
MILLMGGLQSGPLCSAVRSPGRPEVEKHWLPLKSAQSHLIAIQVRQRQVWCRGALGGGSQALRNRGGPGWAQGL